MSDRLAPSQARALGRAQVAVDAADTALANASASAAAVNERCVEFLREHAPALAEAARAALAERHAAAAAAAKAREKRAELTRKYVRLLPVGEVVAMAGFVFARTQRAGRRSFAIARYLDDGHKLTAAMRRYYGPGEPSDELSIRGQA